MKLKGILLTSALTAMLGVGVFAGVSGNKNAAPVEKAEATDTIDIFCTISFDYLNDNYVGIHQWGGETPGTEWGTFTPMTKVFDNENGQPVFKASIPSDRTGLIFIAYQDSAMKQTANITTNIKNNQGWYFSGWSDGKMTVGEWDVKPYTINYYGNGSTSGSMASQTAYANVAWGLTSNAFSKTDYRFVNWNTSPNGGGTSYSNGALIPKNSEFDNDTLNLYAQWERVYPAGRYIVGHFGSCDWDVSNALLMEYKNSQYEKTSVSLERGDILKIAYYDGAAFHDNSYVGYGDTDPYCQAYFCFDSDNDGNLRCVAGGTYNFYYSDSGWGGKFISIAIDGSSRTAEQLAAKLMSFGAANPGVDGNRDCGDEGKFPLVKSMYLNNLSESEQSKFRGYASSGTAHFKNAYDRYIAWADALGEKYWEEGKKSGSVGFMNNMPEESTAVVTTTATVVVSIIAISTAAGFLFLKKKKNF